MRIGETPGALPIDFTRLEPELVVQALQQQRGQALTNAMTEQVDRLRRSSAELAEFVDRIASARDTLGALAAQTARLESSAIPQAESELAATRKQAATLSGEREVLAGKQQAAQRDAEWLQSLRESHGPTSTLKSADIERLRDLGLDVDSAFEVAEDGTRTLRAGAFEAWAGQLAGRADAALQALAAKDDAIASAQATAQRLDGEISAYRTQVAQNRVQMDRLGSSIGAMTAEVQRRLADRERDLQSIRTIMDKERNSAQEVSGGLRKESESVAAKRAELREREAQADAQRVAAKNADELKRWLRDENERHGRILDEIRRTTGG